MNKDYFEKTSSLAKKYYDFSLMTEEETTILEEIVEKLPKLSKYALRYLYRETKYHYFAQPDMYHVDIDDDEAIRRRQAAGENQITFVDSETLDIAMRFYGEEFKKYCEEQQKKNND